MSIEVWEAIETIGYTYWFLFGIYILYKQHSNNYLPLK